MVQAWFIAYPFGSQLGPLPLSISSPVSYVTAVPVSNGNPLKPSPKSEGKVTLIEQIAIFNITLLLLQGVATGSPLSVGSRVQFAASILEPTLSILSTEL